MRNSFIWVLSMGVAILTMTAGCAADDKAVKPGEQYHARLREIAKSYKAYGPVEYAEAAWAPTFCRAPIPYQDYRPGEARSSASGDTETHGKKLYFLFARTREDYLQLKTKSQPEGQVIVKESWTQKEATEQERTAFLSGVHSQTQGVPFARKDGKLFRTDKQGELFVMFKTADKADADQGWVYGTVTPDGKTVTSAGRVESCMNCHQTAKHDRLFGLPGELAKIPSKELPKALE